MHVAAFLDHSMSYVQMRSAVSLYSEVWSQFLSIIIASRRRRNILAFRAIVKFCGTESF